MSIAIRPEYLTLDELLQKRLFRIPSYQRAYSWGKPQRSHLFEDIQKVSRQSKDRHHFMSTIVCLRTAESEEIGTDEFSYLHVVDGQQRLTTLVILLKSIQKALTSGDSADQMEAAKLQALLVKDARELILLQTNHDSSSVFRNYVLHGAVPQGRIYSTTAEQNLIEAFRECEAFVDTWQGSSALLDLLKLLKNRLDFIFYVLQDEGSVYTVFEVLNSRGLPVDPLDKCKSMLMGIAFERLDRMNAAETINELHKIWSEIYRTLGTRTFGDDVLRFAATLGQEQRPSRTVSAEAALEQYREFCEKDPMNIIEASEGLLGVTTLLCELMDNNVLRAVNRISQARLLAVALRLTNQVTDQQRGELMRQWENVTFRIFGMCSKDARTKVGEYVRLAWDIVSGPLTYDRIRMELIALGSDYPVEEAVKELRSADCYNGWEEELRYMMYRYEQHLAAQAGAILNTAQWADIWSASPSKSIEHVHPQTASSAWKGVFGTEENRTTYVHRLGNLLLLPPGPNSQAGNKGFEEKKGIYQNNYLRMMDDVLARTIWNRKAVREREEKILEWAVQQWADIP